MKIVYCLLETYTPGGIGRIASLKANYLANLGWEVYIVTTDQNNQAPYYVIDKRVKQIDLGINLLANDKNNPIKWFFRKKRLTSLHKKKLSDLLFNVSPNYVVSTFSNDANFLCSIKDGSKKILECHFNHDFYKITSDVYNYSFIKKCFANYKIWHNDKLVNKYDAFITLTYEDYILWGRKKNMFVIPNMLSFQNDIRTFDRYKRIIAVGHFNEQKSFDKLILIWSKIYNKYPSWSLHIYGDGPHKNKYLNLIKELYLTRSCFIHSPTQNIKEEYNKASILCMTSTYEGLPMVLLEGMACGLPIVAYACKCGPKDVIKDNKTGYCIDKDDEVKFIEKLSYLIEYDNCRNEMMKASYDESLKYSEQVIMKKWLSLFDKL